MNKFLLVVLFCHALFGEEHIKEFLNRIPKEEVSILDSGVRRILRSFGGFVLYGDKPICIENISGDAQPNLYLNEEAIAKGHLFAILKKWSLVDLDRNYQFLFTNYANHKHLLIINRSAFIKTVNQNLPLFRYILDSEMTAEGLLENLIKNQDCFYDVLKDDTALIGILLGYGTNNSITYRQIQLARAKYSPETVFPFLTREEQPELSSNIKDTPDQQASWDLSRHTTYRIPCFGCDPNSQETLSLLDTYEKNREQIITAANRENFLESFLERIFTTTSGKIRLPKEHSPSPCDLNNPKDLLDGFANAILAESPAGSKRMAAFLGGMRDREENATHIFDELGIQRELFPLSIDLRDQKNLERSEGVRKALTRAKGWVQLIEDNVLYKIVKRGHGKTSSSKVKSVTFHYSFRTTSGSEEFKMGTIVQAKVASLISGLGHLFVGMKRGEERLVYIHPRYAYGDRNLYPNEAILAKIGLVDFMEGQEETIIAAEQSLDSKEVYFGSTLRNQPKGTYKELLRKHEELIEKKAYINGYNFWDDVKSLGLSLDVEQLIEHIQSLGGEPQNEEQRVALIFNFKAHLFHKRYINNEISTTPFCF